MVLAEAPIRVVLLLAQGDRVGESTCSQKNLDIR